MAETEPTSSDGARPEDALRQVESPAGDPGARADRQWPRLALVALVGLLAYSNSFSGVFILDDEGNVVGNPAIRQLWPPPLKTNRPLVELSLAINYRLGGLDVAGYHAFNLAVHILAGLALFGLVRRTLALLEDRVAIGRFRPAGDSLALAVALIWVAHPLNTESVTYIIQRAEAMMGLCYLATLYCAARSLREGGRWAWAAAGACAAGMACKEVMVTAPVAVVLYDRCFAGRCWPAVLARRWRLYAVLAATWIVLAVVTLRAPSGGSAGFGMARITPLDYLKNQPHVVAHYLGLAFWPGSLCLDYRWFGATGAGEVLPWAALMAALLAATAWALWRHPAVGFLGAAFFLVLLPSSSILPIADLAAEHRMYLPLAAAVALTVMAARAVGRRLLAGLPGPADDPDRAGRWIGLTLLGAVVAVLTGLTFHRNLDYHDPQRMWADVVAKRPGNPRAWHNLGRVFQLSGQLQPAAECYAQAMRLMPELPGPYNNLAAIHLARGQYSQARQMLNKAVLLDAADPHARFNLGVLSQAEGLPAAAVEYYRATLKRDPNYLHAANNLARLLASCPDDRLRNGTEAVALARRACQATGQSNPVFLDTLAAAYAETGQYGQAQETARQALTLAGAAGEAALARDIRAHLSLYESGKPYRAGR